MECDVIREALVGEGKVGFVRCRQIEVVGRTKGRPRNGDRLFLDRGR
jgi:hypothetical protein